MGADEEFSYQMWPLAQKSGFAQNRREEGWAMEREARKHPLARARLRGCDVPSRAHVRHRGREPRLRLRGGRGTGTVPTRASSPHSRRPARAAWSTQPHVLRAPGAQVA